MKCFAMGFCGDDSCVEDCTVKKCTMPAPLNFYVEVLFFPVPCANIDRKNFIGGLNKGDVLVKNFNFLYLIASVQMQDCVQKIADETCISEEPLESGVFLRI